MPIFEELKQSQPPSPSPTAVGMPQPPTATTPPLPTTTTMTPTITTTTITTTTTTTTTTATTRKRSATAAAATATATIKSSPEVPIEGEYACLHSGYARFREDDFSLIKDGNLRLLVIVVAPEVTAIDLNKFIGTATVEKKPILVCETKDLEHLKTKLHNVECDTIPISPSPKEFVNSNIEIVSSKHVTIGHFVYTLGSLMNNSFQSLKSVLSNPYFLWAMKQDASNNINPTSSSAGICVALTMDIRKPTFTLANLIADTHHFWVESKPPPTPDKTTTTPDKTTTLQTTLDTLENDMAAFKHKNEDTHPQTLIVTVGDSSSDFKCLKNPKIVGPNLPQLIFYANRPPRPNEVVLLKPMIRLLDASGDDHDHDDGVTLTLVHDSDFDTMTVRATYKPNPTSQNPSHSRFLYRRSHVFRSAIVSDYGSGKSHLTEQLLAIIKRKGREDETKGEAKALMVRWVVRVEMKTLEAHMNSWSLLQLAERYWDGLKLTEWQRAILSIDIKDRNVLWMLDGYDEMCSTKEKETSTIVGCILRNQHSLTTMRPNARSRFPRFPHEIVSLHPFDVDQMQEFVSQFFATVGELATQIPTIVDVVQSLSKEIPLLGKPLMCRIVCEIIKDDEGVRTSKLKRLSLAALFNEFALMNLRKYLHDQNRIPKDILTPNKIYHLSHSVVQRLKSVAFATLVQPEEPLELTSDKGIDNEITNLGIITTVAPNPATRASHYTFDHQTQIEYLAALACIDRVLTLETDVRSESCANTWSDILYNSNLSVMWQFVAGTVSKVSEDGNALIGNNSHEAFIPFCSLILKAPKDLVGVVGHKLISDCVANMTFSRDHSEWEDKINSTLREITINDSAAASGSDVDVDTDADAFGHDTTFADDRAIFEAELMSEQVLSKKIPHNLRKLLWDFEPSRRDTPDDFSQLVKGASVGKALKDLLTKIQRHEIDADLMIGLKKQIPEWHWILPLVVMLKRVVKVSETKFI